MISKLIFFLQCLTILTLGVKNTLADAPLPWGDSTTQFCTENDFKGQTLCPRSWVLAKDIRSCLLFSKFHADWEVARNNCRSQHESDLVRTEDLITTQILSRYASLHLHGKFWIGLRKESNEEALWLDDTVPALWSHWHTKIPSLADQGCALLDSNTSFWEMERCSNQSLYVCQKYLENVNERNTITFVNEFGSRRAYQKAIMNFVCMSTDNENDVQFVLHRGNVLSVINSPDTRLKEYKTYIKMGNRCVLRKQNVLQLTLDENDGDTSVRCCQKSAVSDMTECEQTFMGRLFMLPGKPEMKVHARPKGYPEPIEIGTQIFVECSALVGTGGMLQWFMNAENFSSAWKVTMEGYVYVNSGVSGAWTYTHDGSYRGIRVQVVRVMNVKMQGPKMVSMLMTTMSEELELATVSCKTRSDTDPSANNKENHVISSPFKKVVKVTPLISDDEPSLTERSAHSHHEVEERAVQAVATAASSLIFFLVAISVCVLYALMRKRRRESKKEDEFTFAAADQDEPDNLDIPFSKAFASTDTPSEDLNSSIQRLSVGGDGNSTPSSVTKRITFCEKPRSDDAPVYKPDGTPVDPVSYLLSNDDEDDVSDSLSWLENKYTAEENYFFDIMGVGSFYRRLFNKSKEGKTNDKKDTIVKSNVTTPDGSGILNVRRSKSY